MSKAPKKSAGWEWMVRFCAVLLRFKAVFSVVSVVLVVSFVCPSHIQKSFFGFVGTVVFVVSFLLAVKMVSANLITGNYHKNPT